MNYNDYIKIIHMAIDREVEAYAFYRAISYKATDNNVKYIFNDLAEDEQSHRHILEGFINNNPDRLHFSEAKDYKIVDALPTPMLTEDLKPAEGLVIAVKKELEAMQMYTQLADASTDAAQKRIFLELASMERGHKNRLEDLYVNMAFPEVW